MKFSLPLLLALLALSPFANAAVSSSEADVIEQNLLLAPTRGENFDSLFARYSEGEGLGKLAERWKAKAESGAPESTAYWVLLSFLADREGHTPDAIECAQRAVALSPTDPRATAALADAFLSARRPKDAVDALQKALAPEAKPQARAALLRQLANAQSRASDDVGALSTWRQLIQEFPADLAALDEAGAAMTYAHRSADAQTFFESLRDAKTANNYEKLTAVFKLAQLAEIQYNDDAARALYRSALSLSDPLPRGSVGWPESEAHDRIEDSFRRAGDLPGLAAEDEKWIAAHPDDFYVQGRLGEILCELARAPEAIPWLRKAAEASPNRRSAWLSLARGLFETGQSQEAMAALHTLAAIPEPPHTGDDVKLTEPEQLTDSLDSIARKTNGDTAKRGLLEELRRIAPSLHDSWRGLGIAARLFRDQGFPADALPLYEAATKLDQDKARQFYRESWADCLFDLKRDAEARKVLHGMVEGPRASAADFLELARSLRRRNETADALQTAQAGLDLDPDNFELLSLEWTLHAAANRWDDAANLAPLLLKTAPNLASAMQVEDNDAQALRKSGAARDTLQRSAQRVKSGAQISEIELRRFVALALRERNLDLTSLGLAAAARLFPNSPEFIRDRAEFELHQGHVEESNAALERLAELQPKEKAAWLRVIARHDLDERLFEKAAAAAQRAIKADSAHPESHMLAADIEIAAGHLDAAAAILRKAILVVRNPNAVRLKLARTLFNAERFDEAASAYAIVFHEDSDTSDRLALIPDLANAFARAGRLDELIARFRTGLRGAEGPWPNMQRDAWPYALYLSEIRRKEGDLPGAREEVVNAFGPRSHSAEFLGQRLQIAKDEQSAPERARLARLYAHANAGRERNQEDHLRIPLLLALAANGDTEEAMQALKERQSAFFTNPMLLHDVLAKLAAAGGGQQIVAFLRSALARHADDWRLRFLLAEACLHNGEIDAADKLLSEMESQPREATAPQPDDDDSDPGDTDSAEPRSLPGQYNGVTYSSGQSGPAGAKFARRMARGFNARQNLARIAAGLESPESSGSVIFRSGTLDPFYGIASGPEKLTEASDEALVVRSILAQKQGRGPAFLAALLEQIQAQPRSERLAILTLVQALDPLLKEIADEAAHPSGDETLNAECLEVLMTLAIQPAPIDVYVDADPAQLISLLQTFLQRERRTEALFGGAQILSKALARVGRAEEAQQVAGDVLDYWSFAPENQDLGLLEFATENGALETARNILSRIAFNSRNHAPFIDENLLSTLQKNFARTILIKNPSDAVFYLNSALRISYHESFPPLGNFQSLHMRSVWNRSRIFLDGNRYIASSFQTRSWSEIFQLAKESGQLAYFVRSRQTPSDLPPEQIARARLARICFLWWNHGKDDAIQEIVSLADSEKSDELHLMAASMLADQGRNDEAQKALAQVSATSGDTAIAKLVLMLELARAANDTEKEKTIAVQLAGLPLSSNDQPRLAQILIQLGLPEKAAELNAGNGARRPSFPGAEANRLAQELQAAVRAKHEPEAIALARLILSRSEPGLNSIEDGARQIAIAGLKQVKALPAYLADLERELGKSPNSARTLLLLAEASGRDQPEEAIDYYRRLVQLAPGNDDYQSRLATVLSESGQREEAMRTWEMLLARRPEAISGSRFFAVFSTYQNAKEMGRLGDALVRAKIRGNPLADLAFARDLSDPIIQVASDLRRTGNVEEAIRLWRAVLESKRLQSRVWFREAETVKSLASALLEQGRKDEAAQELETYFFPPAQPKSALGFDLHDGGREWMSPSFDNGSLSSFQGMPLIRLAAQAGALDRLRAHAIAAAAARPQDPVRFLALLIDVIRRDPAKLAGLKSEFDETIRTFLKSRNPMAANALFILGRMLGDWPEARPLALSIEERSSEPFEYLNTTKSLPRAELAAQLGEWKTARVALRAWTAASDHAASEFGLSNPAQDLLAVDLMSRAGMATEARDALRKLRAALDVHSFPDLMKMADDLSNRLALLTGDSGQAQITVWAAPRTDGAQKTTLYWEIGSAPSDSIGQVGQVRPAAPNAPGRAVRPVRLASPSEPPATVIGEDLPELDGRFSIEFFHGPTPSALEPLTTIPVAKMRGSWESSQPLPQGYVVAVLREKDIVRFTRKTFLPGGANLLVNPNLDSPAAPRPPNAATAPEIPGWPGLNPADIEPSPDSPNIGGHSMRLGLLREFEHSTIALQRVPLDPGQSYYFTSWLHAENPGARIWLSGRFLDKDGKPTGQTLSNFTPASGRWISGVIRLDPARGPRRGAGAQQIPANAAFFEPQLLTSGAQFEMSGLYFGEISPDPTPAK